MFANQHLVTSPTNNQTWGQILSKVFKCKCFQIFQMQMQSQILLFSSNANANTFQKVFKYFQIL